MEASLPIALRSVSRTSGVSVAAWLTTDESEVASSPVATAPAVHDSRIDVFRRQTSPNELESTGPAVARPARPAMRLAPWSRTAWRPNTRAMSAAANASGMSRGVRSFST